MQGIKLQQEDWKCTHNCMIAMMLTLKTVALSWIPIPNVDSNYTNIPYPQNGSGIIPRYFATGIIPQLNNHIYNPYAPGFSETKPAIQLGCQYCPASKQILPRPTKQAPGTGTPISCGMNHKLFLLGIRDHSGSEAMSWSHQLFYMTVSTIEVLRCKYSIFCRSI